MKLNFPRDIKAIARSLAPITLLLLISGCSSGPSTGTEPTADGSPSETVFPPTSRPSVPPDTDLPPAPASSPFPTRTFTPQPTVLPTAIPIPSINRVLHLASPNLSGEDVRMIQAWLSSLDYTEVGVPDGVFGSLTDQAVRRFQEDQGLEVDGVVGEQTWTRLFFLNEAQQIEARLIDLGYGICTANDDYTEQTTAAIQQFQATNGLEGDGVMDQATWMLLFSREAVPFPRGVSLDVSMVGEVGKTGSLAFDGEYLWLAGSETLVQIDPVTGGDIHTIPFPDLGMVTDPFGITYSNGFNIDKVFFGNGLLWVSGKVVYYPNLIASAALVFDLSDETVAGPIFLSGREAASFWVPALFTREGSVWAVHDASPNFAVFELNAASSQAGRGIPLRNVQGVYDAVSDGETVWMSLLIDGDRTVRTFNMVTGRFGAPLSVCGYDLAYDGEWLWVERSSSVLAIDPSTGQIMARARADGSIGSIVSDGKGTLWVLVNQASSWALQVVEAR